MLRTTINCSTREAGESSGAYGAAERKARSDEFRRLLLAETPKLYALAWFLERQAALADDLVQDTVERALRFEHRFTPGSSLKNWVSCIMQNLFRDRCRSRAAIRFVSEDLAQGEAPEPREPALWESASLDDVRAALPLLAEPLRVAFGLWFFEGLSYQQVAEQIQVPVATVGTRLLRARMRLRSVLVPHQQEGAALNPRPV